MVELTNGANIEFDWNAITQKEWRVLINKDTDLDTNDQIVGKLVGMTGDELSDMNPVDYRKIATGMWESFKAACNLDDAKN